MRAVLSTKKFKTKTVPFITGLLVAVVGLVSGLTFTVSRVSAADCDSNSIIYCGFSTASNFISKVKGNDSGNGHHDLQSIYAHQFASGQYLSSSMYDDFAAHAVTGTAYKNNTIVVGGKVIATDTSSIGREASVQGPGVKSYPVGSSTYYGNTNDRAFATDGLPVYVLFDKQGVMQFAVLKSCGNPIFGTPKPSHAQCTDLQKTAVSGQLNTYDFRASTNVSGNASLSKLVYSFGDGSKPVTITSNFGQTVRHQYTRAGSPVASVAVYVDIPGYPNLQLPQVSLCTKTIPVVLPFFSCASLTPFTVDKEKFMYKFVAKASNGNGAVFVSTDYDFGDNTAIQNVKTTDGKTTTVTHTFAKNAGYNISALLHFTVNGKPATAQFKCTASTTASTCKPGIPVGDVRCTPCETNPSIPASDTANCVTPPPSLPNTGAGNVIAIFSAVVVAGFLAYRHLLFRRHKAAFLAAQHGVSPLPLGDPLNDEAPLTGTPLAPKKRSFRRNRPF